MQVSLSHSACFLVRTVACGLLRSAGTRYLLVPAFVYKSANIQPDSACGLVIGALCQRLELQNPTEAKFMQAGEPCRHSGPESDSSVLTSDSSRSHH